MIKNLQNEEMYRIVGVKEQEDCSFHVALEPVDGLQTTSWGCVMDKKGYQKISNKHWDHDELLNESMSFLHGAVKRSYGLLPDVANDLPPVYGSDPLLPRSE